MSYYVQHKIYLKDSDKEKLLFLKGLLDEYNSGMEIATETVYDNDGEPFEKLCLSDAAWNFGSGCTWYMFDTNMLDISEKFNQKYPGESIYAYIKTEDGCEETYKFEGGDCQSDKVVHFREELEKVCRQLNKEGLNAYGGLYNVEILAGHPTVRFHDGAYTIINWNYFELYKDQFTRSYNTTPPTTMYDPTRNYNSLENRSRAMKLLYDYIVEHRSDFR